MIIVTRPSPFGEELVQKCKNAGLEAIHCPFFKIMPTPNTVSKIQNALNQLTKQDIVIITSPQIPTILATQNIKMHFPSQLNYYAIGQQSAEKFEQLTNLPIQFAKENESSETLFQLIYKQTPQKALILTGDVNRPYLKQTLTEHGWNVNRLTCYYRELISYPQFYPTENDKNLTIVITSVEHLLQLDKYSNKSHKEHNKLIVSHERIKSCAQDLGWQKIYLTNSANNQILFKTIASLCHNAR
ncbi:uroporphyrinogen-III synthase [Orbaceae bacterium ac157xtp]